MRTELEIRKRLNKIQEECDTDAFYAASDGWHGHLDKILFKEKEILEWVLNDLSNEEKIKKLEEERGTTDE